MTLFAFILFGLLGLGSIAGIASMEISDRRRRRPDPRDVCERAVSKVMDEAPEWRDWFAAQLELLDMRYNPGHWITTEWIR